MQQFEQVYTEHFDYVYHFVLGLCRDPSLAEEIAQQSFFQAIKGINRFDGRCTMRAFLCQIAKNTYFSHVRKHKRLAPMETLPEAYSDGLDVQMLSAERSRALHAALHRLPEPYKEVFSLRVFAELPHTEIAKLFGKSESWARVTFHRARLILQEKTEEDEI